MHKLITYYTTNQELIDSYKIKSTKLWNDHVVYTRNVIISLLAGIVDADSVVTRLLKNQEDIGDLYRPYYDSSNVNNIVSLLKEHVIIAGGIISAVMNKLPTIELESQWRENCDSIAALLITLNPSLEESVLMSVWRSHLELTLDEIKFRAEKNWTSDILTFDKILSNASEIAELLATSVIDQFPLKFCAISNGEIE